MEVDLIVDANGHFARVFFALSSENSNNETSQTAKFGMFPVYDPDDDPEHEPDLYERVFEVMSSGLLDLMTGGHEHCTIDPRPTRLMVIWDAREDHRRSKMRSKPIEYYEAMDYVRPRLEERFGGTHFIAPEEADDAIASAAFSSEDEGNLVYVASSDKDIYQILSDRIKIYSWHQKGWITPGYVLKRWGLIKTSHIALYLALVGDQIDKIPGVSGVGAKTFAKIYSSVDKKMGLVEACAAIEAHLPGKERQFREMLNLTLLNGGMDVPRPSPYRLRSKH